MKWKQKLLASALTASMLLPMLPSQAHMAPATPAVADVPGAWAAGQSPAQIDPNKPVLLFVHGLTSQAKVWYNENDMYDYAYNNGYQTAFINMYDISGTPEDMWKDGELLAAKIKEISQKYGKKLVIIAHSKGGVDTQSALVRYNAYPYVSRVITLSSPHHGSQLADLAYSSWAGWLADLIGSQSPGTSSLQTSYMEYFRSEMAKDADVNKVPFYTMSGDQWSGSSKASYTFGGAYLSVFGSNDGVVTTDSAVLPGSQLIQKGPWNHATVRTGSYTFNLFKPYIGTVSGAASTPALSTSSVTSSVYEDVYQPHVSTDDNTDSSSANGHYYVRGGNYNGTATETLTVEDNVQSVTLDWISSQPVTSLELISPTGDVQQVQVNAQPDDEIFKGAYHQLAQLNTPIAGDWQVKAISRTSGAYLMTAVFTGSNNQASLNSSLSANTLNMNVQTEGLDHEQTSISYTVDYYDVHGKRIAAPTEQQRSLTSDAIQERIPTPTSGKPSNYVITSDIEGKTDTGAPYKRTLIQSVYVDANGTTYSHQD
ncbi:esterase/lipase family protein [Paenibacillus sp. WLX1005]|uniref:esterase/lipase family protein n=1 Tax=Paenibacillus sp. WLX1005 TaxID=3243766 RepID=UPI0039840162